MLSKKTGLGVSLDLYTTIWGSGRFCLKVAKHNFEVVLELPWESGIPKQYRRPMHSKLIYAEYKS
jgi:hypothetical protein